MLNMDSKDKEISTFDDPEVREIYAEFTASGMNGTFHWGFKEGAPRRVPFCARKKDSNWLDRVCEIHKRDYGTEIEYYFEGNLCYFKEK